MRVELPHYNNLLQASASFSKNPVKLHDCTTLHFTLTPLSKLPYRIQRVAFDFTNELLNFSIADDIDLDAEYSRSVDLYIEGEVSSKVMLKHVSAEFR